MNRDDNKGKYHFGSEMIYSKYYVTARIKNKYIRTKCMLS